MAELLAQLRDVDLDRAGLAGRDEPPHGLEQLVAGDHLPGVAEQVLEQIELALGQLDLARRRRGPRGRRGPASPVRASITSLDSRPACARLGAAPP